MLLPSARRQWRTSWTAQVVVAFIAGTTAGALPTALALWLASGLTAALPDAWRLYLLAVGAGLLLLARYGPVARFIPLPEARRQIPAEAVAGNATRGALRFGFELGTGVRTYVPALAPYLLALTILVGRPSLYLALLAGLGFGVARGLPLLARALAPELTMQSLRYGVARAAPLLASFAVFGGGIALVS